MKGTGSRLRFRAIAELGAVLPRDSFLRTAPWDVAAPVKFFIRPMAKDERFCYTFGMKKWDRVQRSALGAHGIITSAQAKAMGVLPTEMYRWSASGRLVKLSRGVFRLAAYPAHGLLSDMAAILASVGEDAYLCGESALLLYDLCPVRSYVADVATPHRFRKTAIPKGVRVVKSEPRYAPAYHDGIACQRPEDAIRSCIGVLERSRLEEAVDEGGEKGYFLPGEVERLKREIAHGKAAAQRA